MGWWLLTYVSKGCEEQPLADFDKSEYRLAWLKVPW